jgi:hypothetical protein
VNEKKKSIEMVSVGGDGKLWIMTGAVGDEVRSTQPFRTTDGKESQLRRALTLAAVRTLTPPRGITPFLLKTIAFGLHRWLKIGRGSHPRWEPRLFLFCRQSSRWVKT